MIFNERKTCEVCSLQSLKKLVELPYESKELETFLVKYYENRIPTSLLAGQKMILNQCQDCGFVWQVHTLTEKYATELYSAWIDPAKSLEKSLNHNRNYYKSLLDDVFFVSTLFDKKPKQIKVLDFGLGWGNWSSAAISMGMDVFGFELSAEKIEYTRKKGIKVISDLNEYESYFDYVHAEQVLEHLDHPFEAMTVIEKIVKPGGLIRISVPNFPNYSINNESYKAKHDALHPLEHINTFQKKNLHLMAKRLKLEKMGFSQFLKNLMKNPKYCSLFFRKYMGVQLSNSILLKKN